MFSIEARLFSIGTIVVPTSVWSNQLVKLITSACLNLVEHVNKPIKPMFKPPTSSHVPIKPIFVRPIKIIIPLDIFQQH
jgi:hypothetical protein